MNAADCIKKRFLISLPSVIFYCLTLQTQKTDYTGNADLKSICDKRSSAK